MWLGILGIKLITKNNSKLKRKEKQKKQQTIKLCNETKTNKNTSLLRAAIFVRVKCFGKEIVIRLNVDLISPSLCVCIYISNSIRLLCHKHASESFYASAFKQLSRWLSCTTSYYVHHNLNYIM